MLTRHDCYTLVHIGEAPLFGKVPFHNRRTFVCFWKSTVKFYPYTYRPRGDHLDIFSFARLGSLNNLSTNRSNLMSWSCDCRWKRFSLLPTSTPTTFQCCIVSQKRNVGGSVADFNWKGTVVRLQLKLSWSWSRLEEDLKKSFYFTLRTFTFSQCSLSFSPQIKWLSELTWKCPHLTFSQMWPVASFGWFLSEFNLSWRSTYRSGLFRFPTFS